VTDGRQSASSSSSAGAFDKTKLNGIFKMTCLSQSEAGSTDDFNQSGPQCSFMNDTFVEMNVHNATAQAIIPLDTDDNGTPDRTITSGTVIPVISVWKATSGTSSARGSGGDGATSAGGMVTWDSTKATDPIAFTAGSAPASVTWEGRTFNLPQLPTVASDGTYTNAQWVTWLQGALDAY
jgi:hypothetical protein